MSNWITNKWNLIKTQKKNYKLLFIHNPKGEGTFVNNILTDLNIKTKPTHKVASLNDQKNYITFTIVRDPIARFESPLNDLLGKCKKVKELPILDHLFNDETRKWDDISLNNVLKLFDDETILLPLKTQKSIRQFCENVDIVITVDQIFELLHAFDYNVDKNKYKMTNVSKKTRGKFNIDSLYRLNKVFMEDKIFYNKIIKKKIFVTGCAGFIGSHLCEKLLKTTDYEVYGIDNLNDYYDVQQKKENLKILYSYDRFHFKKDDLITTDEISNIKPEIVVNIAAMAGVRYSLENPTIYMRTNVEGHVHLMNECVKNNVKHYVYASSSSVYGTNKKIPFSENDEIQDPNSPYAASKISGEIMAKLYNKLYKLPVIGLRFFTVYGPRGRPDMAPFKFLSNIMNEKAFDKYGDGNTFRDYTYIDDIISGIIGAINNKNNRTCEIYNLGNSNTVNLNQFIQTCEQVTGKSAIFNQLPEQQGDVPKTYSDITKAKQDLDYDPKTNLLEGLTKMYEWLKQNQ